VNANALAMLKGLLGGSGHSDDLIPFLSKKQAEELPTIQVSHFSPRTFLSLTDWAEVIHFSWLSQTLKNYSPTAQALFLAVLPASQREDTKKMLSITFEEKSVAPFLRPFLLDYLRTTVQEPYLVSFHNLPDSPLNVLLQIERKELIHLADLLGLYDLAADLRQVVDKGLLGKIYKALNTQQLHFLHYCSKQPLKWVSAKLGLQAWDGSKKQLNHLLHFRGLVRIAKAIYPENTHFKWHLLHRLDTGRAKVIQKELYNKQDPALYSYFRNQVLHVAKRYLHSEKVS
jgi:hypothetical protein